VAGDEDAALVGTAAVVGTSVVGDVSAGVVTTDVLAALVCTASPFVFEDEQPHSAAAVAAQSPSTTVRFTRRS
jgi:hypothetical protein